MAPRRDPGPASPAGRAHREVRREARRPQKSRELALALLGEYTHEATKGPEDAMVARETLADLLALACERGCVIVSMRVRGYSTAEIAARV